MRPKPGLLVITSTYPRWEGDTEPGFVQELCRRVTSELDVSVLAPHAYGAQTRERLDDVDVYRFRYLPAYLETLAYGGGIPVKLRNNPLHFLQVPAFVFAQLVASLRLLARGNFKIIHAHWILPQGVIAVFLKRILRMEVSVVCTAHGADLYAFRGGLAGRLKSWVVRNVDLLTVVSDAMVQPALALGARRECLRVASMGVDTQSLFVPPANQLQRIPRRLLFAGRLVEKKGVPVLLDALQLVVSEYPDIHLYIIGDGPQRGALEGHAARLHLGPHVTFLGALTQKLMVAHYQSAAAAVFPFVVAEGGDREGLGLVMVEAQACGCPVIASDLDVVHDVIKDGETGLFARSGDPPDLARAIRLVLKDSALASRLAHNGRISAAERFSWERRAGVYVDLFRDLISPST